MKLARILFYLIFLFSIDRLCRCPRWALELFRLILKRSAPSVSSSSGSNWDEREEPRCIERALLLFLYPAYRDINQQHSNSESTWAGRVTSAYIRARPFCAKCASHAKQTPAVVRRLRTRQMENTTHCTCTRCRVVRV